MVGNQKTISELSNFSFSFQTFLFSLGYLVVALGSVRLTFCVSSARRVDRQVEPSGSGSPWTRDTGHKALEIYSFKRHFPTRYLGHGGIRVERPCRTASATQC